MVLSMYRKTLLENVSRWNLIFIAFGVVQFYLALRWAGTSRGQSMGTHTNHICGRRDSRGLNSLDTRRGQLVR